MLVTIIIFILTLFILVVIHELGHFLVAKKFGIKVLEFGFGLPPRIMGKKIGETLVSLNWLPIGGFVKLLGEDDLPSDDHDPDMARHFSTKPPYQRILVVVAGVVMNLLLSWVFFYIVIISNNFNILLPTADPIVAINQVEANSPAQAAGLKPGDRITAVNNQTVGSPDSFVTIIKQDAGQSITLTVADWNGSAKRQIQVTPRKNPPPGQGALGVVTTPFAMKEFKTPLEKIFAGPIYSYELCRIIIPSTGQIIAELFSGNFKKASTQVSGPVGIVVASNSILKEGWQSVLPYVWFMGMLSLNLSLVNILPIPGLDGGRALFLSIEAITRKRVNPTLEKYIHASGLVVLLSLIVLITFSDIQKLF